MDPLVELPKPALARIKAREAEAAEFSEECRRAAEGDWARAGRFWGGYIDLYKDNLREALEEARANLNDGALFASQYLFDAHATEYRSVLRDPGELEPVLARLREAVIKQYGEPTRAAIQCKEAQEMEKASAAQEAAPEGVDEAGGPILAGDVNPPRVTPEHSLSTRDIRVHKIVGEQNFRNLTNAEIMKTLKQRLRQECKLDSGEALRACLDRIRRANAYPLSRDIGKKRSVPK